MTHCREKLDRISGSGVFARDPNSLITFTKHKEGGAFAVEMVLRNAIPNAASATVKVFELLKALEEDRKVQKSVIDGKWEQIHRNSRNSNHEKDQ